MPCEDITQYMPSTLNNIKAMLARYDRLWIIIAWVIATFLLYLKFGVGFNLESVKYIREADHLIREQSFSQARYLFYLGTIAIIALNKLIGTGLYGAVLMIMLINASAYLVFYRALKIHFQSAFPALAIVFLLMGFWPYQQWSLFLYTECLFYSLLLFLFAHLLRVKKFNLKAVAGSLLLVLALMITRPLGILFALPVLLFFFTLMTRRQRILLWGFTLVAFAAGAWIIQVVFTTTPDWSMHRAVMEENIICDMTPPVITYQPDVTESRNPFYQLFYYITHNFPHFAELALTRLRYFFGMIRPYYATTTNLFIGAYLLLMYLAIISGFRKQRWVFPRGIRLFMWSSILLFALAIAVQCDDYHNRFFLALLPIIVTMAVGAIWQRRRVSS